MPEKPASQVRSEKLALSLSYFGYIFDHQRQKARLRPEVSPKFLSTLGPNLTRKAPLDLQLCCHKNVQSKI